MISWRNINSKNRVLLMDVHTISWWGSTCFPQGPSSHMIYIEIMMPTKQ